MIGPGQVAPGMDEATFERLRGWKTGPGARQPAGRKGPAPAKRRAEAESQAARRAKEIASEAVKNGLRELGSGAGPVDVFGFRPARS